MIFGIIAEYNPFHNGHLYHIMKSRELTGSDNCIVVMSGNFTQRGEPALLNKQERVRCALLNGVSIVIELPVPFATGSADMFAFGAVNLLNSLNIIDYLCFGVETDDLMFMTKISEILAEEPKDFKRLLSERLSKGISYPAARENALSEYLKKYITEYHLRDLSFLRTPNNILAIEYVKALKKSNSSIKPITIKRKKSDFHSININSEIASATAIRNSIKNLFEKKFYDYSLEEQIKSVIPKNTQKILFDELRHCSCCDIENYMPVLDYILRTKSKKELSEIFDVTEGLENRILKFSTEKTIDSLLIALKTKRYTLSKLKHALLHIILDIKKKDVFPYLKTGLPYIRVLGFRKDKTELLTRIAEKASVPLITNIKSAEKSLSLNGYSLLKKEILSSDLYYMNTTKEINSEYTKPIVIV